MWASRLPGESRRSAELSPGLPVKAVSLPEARGRLGEFSTG